MAVASLALVTGAARRLGRAFAESAAREGYAIALHYWTAGDAVEATTREITALGVPVFLIQADLTSWDGVLRMFEKIDGISHPLKLLVNSAGVFGGGRTPDLDIAAWTLTMDLNLRAAYLCAEMAAHRMQPGGLIVNITDVGARKPWSRYPAYTASKAALEALTGALARAYAPGIRVNAIAPGLILRSNNTPEADWQRLIDRLPMRRSGSTSDVAAALQFLIRNEYVTGQTMVVDGGYALVA